MWYVYILRSTKKPWYYVGSTNRLETRIKEHNSHSVRSSKYYAPLQLVYRKEFSTEMDARAHERLLKDKRIEKEKIIKEIEDRYCGIV